MAQEQTGIAATILRVAVPANVHEIYSYADCVPGRTLPLGTQVGISFGARKAVGYIVGYESGFTGRIKPIDFARDQEGRVPSDVLTLCQWAAEYYHHPLGLVLATAMPAKQRLGYEKILRITDKGIDLLDNAGFQSLLLSGEERSLLEAVRKKPIKVSLALKKFGAALFEAVTTHGFAESVLEEKIPAKRRSGAKSPEDRASDSAHQLNVGQTQALEALKAAVGQGFCPFLLHGVTGSGKTEVYMRIVEEVLSTGRSAIVMVPEIALTPQLENRFKARFTEAIAVVHSGISDVERGAEWQKIAAGTVKVVLGTRSAVFAPVANLGILVVDEEHDGSFKQDNGLKYNARDLALVRARESGAIAVLGSATPSLDTYANTITNKYRKLVLPERATAVAGNDTLPEVRIIDLRQYPKKKYCFAPPLIEAITRTLEKGEQTILFLNRRGYAPVIQCHGCGKSLRCSACNVSLTYHKSKAILLCHYCGKTSRVPTVCASCGATEMAELGLGIEKVEAVARELFPTARLARLDRDSITTNKQLGAVLDAMRRREIDILIGTQIVAKGHDFPWVTLVGILQPDQAMNLPDFRSVERSFQLLEQVAGRAGRGAIPGVVMVQTYDPQNPVFAALAHHDVELFLRDELIKRKEAEYPPYAFALLVRVEGEDGELCKKHLAAMAKRLRESSLSGVRFLGPAEAPLALLRGKKRYQLWVFAPKRDKIAAAGKILRQFKVPPGLRQELDVDPQNTL